MTPTLEEWYRARTLGALGVAVKGAREAKGITQETLAARIGSSRATISRLERGSAVSTDTLLSAVAATGYELVAIPRGARIRIEDRPWPATS